MDSWEKTFVGRAMRASVRGFGGVWYPILSGIMGGMFRAGMLLALLGLMMSWYGGMGGSPWAWSGFLGVPITCWWIFSVACGLGWWRSLGEGRRMGRWLDDLPAMLAISVVFGLLRLSCLVALALGCYGILFRGSGASVVFCASSGFMYFFVGWVHPSVVADRLGRGPGLCRAIVGGVASVIKHPLKGLAVHALPSMAVWTLWGAACIEVFLGNILVAACLLAVAAIIGLVWPSFWMAFAYREEDVR